MTLGARDRLAVGSWGTGAETVHQAKVTLKGIRPPIWRRIQVRSGVSLYKLHQILQVTMGWENYHLYEFRVGGVCYGEPDPDFGVEVKSARTAKLSQVAPDEKAKLTYVYDFGDDWEHDVLVEKLLPAEPGVRYPICLAGKRACPPEDCGGIWGYGRLLEVIRNPDDPEHEEMMEWLAGGFDPEEFNLDSVNRELRRVG